MEDEPYEKYDGKRRGAEKPGKTRKTTAVVQVWGNGKI